MPVCVRVYAFVGVGVDGWVGVCVCMCLCACVRACMRVCDFAYVCVFHKSNINWLV